jgi:hypothetical protein
MAAAGLWRGLFGKRLGKADVAAPRRQVVKDFWFLEVLHEQNSQRRGLHFL